MRVSDFFAGYLPGLSFFLLLHSVIYLFTLDGSFLSLIASLLAFTFVYLLDYTISRKWVFALICIVYMVFWVLMRIPELVIISFGAAIYSSYTPMGLRASGFRGLKKSKQASFGTDLSGRQRVYYWGYSEHDSFKIGGNKKWIILIGILTAMLGFTEPDLMPVVLRNFALACIADVICRQSIRSNSFFRSYYSKGITQKTLHKLVLRGYKIILPLFLFMLIISSLVLMPTYPQPVFPESDSLNRNARTTLSQNESWVSFNEALDEYTPNVRENVRDRWSGFNFLGVFYYVGIAFVVILCALIILTFYMWLSKRRKQNLSQFDDFEDSIEIAEATDNFSGTTTRRKFFNFGPNITVRRLFTKKVREYVRRDKISKPKKGDTPKQLVLVIEETENIEVLDSLYHKARYSDEEVSRSDLKKLKG